MAYTKAPVSDTHNTIRIPTLGTPIEVSGDSPLTSEPTSLNYIDCYPFKEDQYGKDPIRRVVKRQSWEDHAVTGATVTASTIGRSIVACEGQPYVYAPIGTVIYKIDVSALAAPTVAVQASGVTASWLSSGTLAINNANVNKVCFLTNTYQLHTWSEDGSAAVQTDLTARAVTGYRGLVFLNGYLFAVNSSGQIFNSAAGGVLTTWNSTDYIIPEMYPDFCEYIELHKNHLVAFSKNSIEFFYDAAIEVGSPLARQESYASRIGIVHTTFPGKVTAKINDDIYFIGRNVNNVKSLYRIRDFKVEEIQNYYVNHVLNWIGSAVSYQQVYGIETVLINSNPQILISLANGYEIIYNPDEDCWWQIRTNGDTLKGYSSNVNTDFPAFNYRVGSCIQPGFDNNYGQQIIFAVPSDGSNGLRLYKPAWETTPTVESVFYTEVIDLGINYYKHIARVDAVGDYGNNTLTLSYNPTPNYDEPYTDCSPTRTPSTAGYGNNASWYNLGAMRRFSLKLKMSGSEQAYHTGFDIEYNAGAA